MNAMERALSQRTDAAEASKSSAKTTCDPPGIRYGAVKVEAPFLATGTQLNTKTFVTTDQTTASELVEIVLSSYSTIYQSEDLFFLGLERTSKSIGQAANRCVRLQDSAKLLQLQARFPKGEAKFTLQLKEEAGAITVHDRFILPEAPEARSIFLNETSTCRDVVKLLIKAGGKTDQEVCHYCLHEVDANGRTHFLKADIKPLGVQQRWREQFECYFEVHLNKKGKENMKRTQSLEEVRSNKRPHNTRALRRSVSCKRESRKSNEELEQIGVKSENFLRGKTNMAKLNENLNKLREHIESIRQRQYQDVGDLSSLGGNVNTGPAHQKRGSCDVKNEKRNVERRRRSTDNTPVSITKSESAKSKTEKAKRVKSANHVQFRSTTSPSVQNKTPEVKMSAFERRRLYDSKVREKNASNQSLNGIGLSSGQSTPRSRPSSADQGMEVQGFKPITPLARIKKGEAKRVLPKPPSQPSVTLDRFTPESDFSFSNPDGCSSPRLDVDIDNRPNHSKQPPPLMSMESMEVLNISKSVGLHNSDYNHYYDYQPNYDDQVFANVQSEDGIIYDDYNNEPEVNSAPYPVEIKSTATLKKIINDLRDAATKPVETSSGSQSHYHSSSSSRSYDLLHSTRSRSYSSEDLGDISQHQQILHQNPTNHPPLHRILKYCSFITATIEKNDLPLFGLRLFQSVFTHKDFGQRRRSVFRTPSGRKPVLNHQSSAFIPVAPTTPHESQESLSIVAIDSLHHAVSYSQPVYEGDYLIEANGCYVAASTIDQVKLAISCCISDLHLVLARPKSLITENINQIANDTDIPKSIEKLRLKYDILQSDADKYLDMIAELKLEVKNKDAKIASLESESNQLKNMIDEVENSCKWEADASENKIVRLTSEVREKDEKITQLSSLLVHQNDLMNMDSVEMADERVSAV